MKPLCKKIYFFKILEIVTLFIGIFLDILFIINRDDNIIFLIAIIVLTSLLIWGFIDSISWILQPNVLIYQYETGIVIHRKIKIEYTSIEKISYKNYVRSKGRYRTYKDIYSGTIYIHLKSGKTYKIDNAYYPLEVVDTISRIKQQKKFR